MPYDGAVSETPLDYALLDRLGAGARMFYPRPDHTPPPPGARDLFVELAPNVRVASRFFPADPAYPTILLFHGNGEVAGDYDDLAPVYHQNQINLWVADYRGYGQSDGAPSFAALVADAHRVLDQFHAELDAGGFAECRLVMGRSLGAHPATELAARRPERLRGLIVESGATSLDRFARTAGENAEVVALIAAHRAKLRAIPLPALVIHGQEDELIPAERALEFYNGLSVQPKELCIIPGAGHNDIWYVGFARYFAAVAAFVRRVC